MVTDMYRIEWESKDGVFFGCHKETTGLTEKEAKKLYRFVRWHLHPSAVRMYKGTQMIKGRRFAR